MNKLIEKILYSFGLNLSFYNINAELEVLKNNLPPTFTGRDVVDIGCGDGVIGIRIEKILKPAHIKGCDLSPSLVKSAKKRGLDAITIDVEKEKISGDLGILWGTLHHFNNPEETLKKIKNNFNSLLIRESIDEKRIFELGYKYNKEKLLNILSAAGINIRNCKIINSPKTKSIIIFIE